MDQKPAGLSTPACRVRAQLAATVALLGVAACGGGSGGERGQLDSGRSDGRSVTGAGGGGWDGGCDSGEPGVLCVAAAGPTHVLTALTVDDQNVYWTAGGPGFSPGVVMKASRAGGPAVTLASLATPSPYQSLVSDGVHLYWSESDGTSNGSIRQVPVAGGPAVTLASANQPACVAVDQVNVYWTEVGSVVKLPKSGGTPTTLASTGGTSLTVDAANVYWLSGSVMGVSKGGGGAVTVWDPSPANAGGDGCRSLALSGATLVAQFARLVDPTQFQLGAIPATGTTSPILLASSDQPAAVVARGTDAFWVGVSDEIDINKTPLQGGPTVTLARPVARSVVDIAVASDGTLYWATDVQIQSLAP